jgi:hypothetical protein
VAAGKPLSLPPDVLAAMAQALQPPAGVASSEALRQWVLQTHHLDVNYHTLSPIVRTKFKAKLWERERSLERRLVRRVVATEH